MVRSLWLGRDETSVPGCDQSRFIQKQRDTLSAVIRALSAFRPPRIWELGAVKTGRSWILTWLAGARCSLTSLTHRVSQSLQTVQTLTFVKTEDGGGKEGKMKETLLYPFLLQSSLGNVKPLYQRLRSGCYWRFMQDDFNYVARR